MPSQNTTDKCAAVTESIVAQLENGVPSPRILPSPQPAGSAMTARDERDLSIARDLFGEERPMPLRPPDPPAQLSLIDAAAERAALRSGRPKSQERAEIIARCSR